MPNSRFYSSIALPTTLTAPIGPSDTTILVASVTGFPALPYTLALDYGASNEELVQVNNVGGLSLDVTRAIDGTSASSHNPGAVVRHVSSARDFTDSRTHEASTSGVHGVVGSVVGTTDTQTLTNKTLTGAQLGGGGTVNGTFSGTATFSGSVSFTSAIAANGGINATNQILTTRASSGSFAYIAQVTGDTNGRFYVNAGGVHGWGSGAATQDSFIERVGVALLQATNTEFRSTRSTTTNNSFSTRGTGDTNDRLRIRADGLLFWGDGTAVDTNLFRNSSGVLRTNNNLVVDGSLSFGTTLNSAPYTAGAWTSWTPTWTTTSGAATPSYGNATVAAQYAVFGKTMHFFFSLTFGNTTNFGAGAGTSDNWQWTFPPGIAAANVYVTNQFAPMGFGKLSQSSNNTSPGVVRIGSNANNFMIDTSGGKQDGNALANSGTIDALTPWTWVAGDIITVFGTLQIA